MTDGITKALAWLAIGLALVVLLTACGPEDNPAPAPTKKCSQPKPSPDPQDPDRTVYVKLCPEPAKAVSA